MAAAGGLSKALLSAAAAMADTRIVVGLSGGPDSAALAWLAIRHATAARAVHVDHNAAASPEMRSAAIKVADQLGVDLTIVDVEVPPGPSYEAHARSVRYDALLAALQPGEVLATAHTADDQAETVMMNMARGGGVRGVAGIPVRRGRIWRPLLETRRADLAALVESQGLAAADDPSNLDRRHLRNRIRSDVMPVLSTVTGADPVGPIARSAHHARAASTLLDRAARRVAWSVDRGVARASLAWLGLVAPVERTETLRAMVAAVRPPYPPSTSEIERVAAVVTGEIPLAELADGLVAARSRWALLVGSRPEPAPAQHIWSEPEVTFGGWTLGRRPWTTHARPLSAYIALIPNDGRPLTVRAPRAADVIRFGQGHKSVRAALGEAGVPAVVRSQHPVVIGANEVLWVPGVRNAPSGWEDEQLRGYLSLYVVEEGPWK